MSDDELDRDWKPSNRPQSTMARSFSLALNDLFKIDNSIADLDAAVSKKKEAVSSQTSELEALEARLRATEERLKARGASPAPPSGRASPRPRQPLAQETFTASPTRAAPPNPPFSPQRPPTTTASNTRPGTGGGNGGGNNRPGTGKGRHGGQESYAPPMPGALPPTPGASEGESSSSEAEYVKVSSAMGRTSADTELGGEDGDDVPTAAAPTDRET